MIKCQPHSAFIDFLEDKRGNTIRKDDQRINNIFTVMSYLAVQQINRIREEGSKYHLQFHFTKLY